jgi:hypothetical protein
MTDPLRHHDMTVLRLLAFHTEQPSWLIATPSGAARLYVWAHFTGKWTLGGNLLPVTVARLWKGGAVTVHEPSDVPDSLRELCGTFIGCRIELTDVGQRIVS